MENFWATSMTSGLVLGGVAAEDIVGGLVELHLAASADAD
jgi:hypothetical protein